MVRSIELPGSGSPRQGRMQPCGLNRIQNRMAPQQFGPYVIEGPLRNGMGEVFRAKDTRLGRTVAIKVIPPHLTARGELRQRFEIEALGVGVEKQWLPRLDSNLQPLVTRLTSCSRHLKAANPALRRNGRLCRLDPAPGADCPAPGAEAMRSRILVRVLAKAVAEGPGGSGDQGGEPPRWLSPPRQRKGQPDRADGRLARQRGRLAYPDSRGGDGGAALPRRCITNS